MVNANQSFEQPGPDVMGWKKEINVYSTWNLQGDYGKKLAVYFDKFEKYYYM